LLPKFTYGTLCMMAQHTPVPLSLKVLHTPPMIVGSTHSSYILVFQFAGERAW